MAFQITNFGPRDATPITSFMWDVKAFSSDIDNGGLAGKLNIKLKDCDLPSYNIEDTTVDTGHIKYKYAKGILWTDVSITFYANISVVRQIELHRNLVWTASGGTKSGVVYKRPTKIINYLYNNIPAVEWVLHNSWVKAFNASKLSYADSDFMYVTAIISYDWADQYVYDTSDKSGLTARSQPPRVVEFNRA